MMRLDAYLAQTYPEISRGIFQKLISQGAVKINGKVVTNASKNVAETDHVEVDLPEPKTFAKEIKDFQKNVIYEDENVVVINKPAGILTHAKGAIAEEFTVADYVKSRIKNPDEFAISNRPGIVHRLDRATSGILIAAKNLAAQKLLQKQFADRKAHKTYLAIVEKAPKLDAAIIDLPIGRNPKKPSSFRIDPKGKSAITNYEVLKHFKNGAALIELKPLTGRTHQLRVHLAAVDMPIIGDPIYGLKTKNQRMFLHAASLEITIPGEIQNERKTFSADLPVDFQAKINQLEDQ